MLADGAQAAPKMPLDMAELGVDFYALTGHKAYAPTGIGALWGRFELLDAMPPFLGGGSMIRKVTKGGTTYADVPGALRGRNARDLAGDRDGGGLPLARRARHGRGARP